MYVALSHIIQSMAIAFEVNVSSFFKPRQKFRLNNCLPSTVGISFVPDLFALRSELCTYRLSSR